MHCCQTTNDLHFLLLLFVFFSDETTKDTFCLFDCIAREREGETNFSDESHSHGNSLLLGVRRFALAKPTKMNLIKWAFPRIVPSNPVRRRMSISSESGATRASTSFVTRPVEYSSSSIRRALHGRFSFSDFSRDGNVNAVTTYGGAFADSTCLCKTLSRRTSCLPSTLV